MDKSINRRLDILQRIAEKNKPAQVVVTFTSGNTIVTDSARAIDLFQRMGPCGEIESFQADGLMSGWAQLMSIVVHPLPDRRLSDYET